jgi:uncharacterized OB-fold protein
MTAGIPSDLITTVESHGKAVAAGDDRAVLGDFMPDRIGQLIASADVPAALKGSEVRSIAAVDDEFYDAIIRYTRLDDHWFELRSRWRRFTDGSWRVFSVRNIPDTAPWMNLTGPAEDGLDAAHWDGLLAGKLMLQRCLDCGTWTWSPRPICPACHSFRMGWEQVDPAGSVYSWTRTWQPFSSEATGHLPYVGVVVELPGAGGRRVMGVLAHADGVTPRIGAAVRGEIEQPPNGAYWPLIRWHLVGES